MQKRCEESSRKEDFSSLAREVRLAKKELEERNERIYEDRQLGLSKEELAKRYFLSEKSIERILLKEKNKRVVL